MHIRRIIETARNKELVEVHVDITELITIVDSYGDRRYKRPITIKNKQLKKVYFFFMSYGYTFIYLKLTKSPSWLSLLQYAEVNKFYNSVLFILILKLITLPQFTRLYNSLAYVAHIATFTFVGMFLIFLIILNIIFKFLSCFITLLY